MPIADSEICLVTEGIWSSVLGISLERSERRVIVDHDHQPLAKDPAGRHVTACVHITGAWQGAVVFRCSAELARRTASLMFGVEAEEASDAEIRDAVGEIVNMAGGNIKALLPAPSQLSLPSVAEGIDFRLSVPGARVQTAVDFLSDGEPLQVLLLARAEHR